MTGVTYPPEFRRSLWSLRRRTNADPLAFLERLAADPRDVVPFSLAGRRTFLLKHPDFVEVVLASHHHKFQKADGLHRVERLLGDGLLTAEGENHRHRRRVVQPAFHRQRLDAYAETMVAHAARFRDRWQPHQVIDVSAEASALTLAIIGEALFGTDIAPLAAEIRYALKAASAATDPLISLLAPARHVLRHRERLAAVIDGLIVQHRTSGDDRENLLSLLLEAREATDRIPGQVRDDALTILLAGHDTTATALVWTWMLLANHPEADARMQRVVVDVLGDRLATAADVPALACTGHVLAESLRLYPPAWVLARRAIDDHELGGVRIPAGSIVLISQYLLHRDARFFPTPLVFDPNRWAGDRQAHRPKMAYFPFGAGPRACVGEGFAWMEGVLLLATVAQRWRLRFIDDNAPISAHPTITLRPAPGIRMVLEERADSGREL